MKNQYQNIQRLAIHLYTILRASSLQKIMQLISCPLLNPPPIFYFAHIYHFLFPSLFRNFLLFKMNILSSVYLEINFPAVPMVKINNLSQQNLSAPPLLVVLLLYGSFQQMFVLFNENVTAASWEMISKHSPIWRYGG